ncbi:(-)-isopiperitenol/(-)-carveol dehydrogenase, mitochondrial-like [Humulus lupulus]|uniref:(-)-isopiperitenol/(-)-carveol dehydrogenase, mitochondrial-like n=1 Tax=Humulus lupulus TaxID=3486 RepID=UPI002B405246|nr:(-)-isopiperitenol/(-)-carveol dehydrogenase, mitochondrial-like [Humulus lupulus]XP_062093149.1 (-)-isopiperitenol/(-)-carveol dehydrogenase, mitochondrial-like [Humulus lupulus]
MSTTTNQSPKPKLYGKVAIITGGASGIGKATAQLFVDHGAVVVIADIQDELGRQVAESIDVSRCSYVHCDVTKEEQVKFTVEWTVQKYHRLDIMFCNAGICSRPPQTVLELDLSTFDRVLAVNTRGVATCVKHAARVMMEQHVRGSIVCMGSAVAIRGRRRFTDYCMSKHAVLGLVRSASLQLGEHGIRVNCVSPSALATPLSCVASRMEAEELERENETFSSLKGVVLKTRHVADAVLFLASDESEFITGHNLEVDGGFIST